MEPCKIILSCIVITIVMNVFLKQMSYTIMCEANGKIYVAHTLHISSLIVLDPSRTRLRHALLDTILLFFYLLFRICCVTISCRAGVFVSVQHRMLRIVQINSPTLARHGDGHEYIRIWATPPKRLVFWDGAPSPYKWYQSHAPNLVMCGRSPKGAQGAGTKGVLVPIKLDLKKIELEAVVVLQVLYVRHIAVNGVKRSDLDWAYDLLGWGRSACREA